jgi:hypothetical protein
MGKFMIKLQRPAVLNFGMQDLFANEQQKICYKNKVLNTSGLIAYLPLDDTSGTVAVDAKNGYHGTYTNSPTLNAAGIGDCANKAVSFNGTSQYVQLSQASIDLVLNRNEGTMMGLAKAASAGVWTDGIFRYVFQIGADDANRFVLLKANGNNLFRCYMARNGAVRSIDATISETAYFNFTMTWSTAANQLIFYVKGIQVGAPSTVTGSVVGSLASGHTRIAAHFTTSNSWSGNLSHLQLYNRALTAAEILYLSKVW